MIAALLFDFDGVIVDSEVARYESWRAIYAEHGAELVVADYLPAVGTGTSTGGAFDAVAHLERLIGGPVAREDVVARRTALRDELLRSVQPLPGIAELVTEARAEGVKTAIVTRNAEREVTGACGAHGLDGLWDLIVCANDEPTRDKTELYAHAVRELGVRAGDAVAFEDSPAGVLAAKGAGVRCVAVPSAITEQAPFEDADAVLPSLAGRTLADLRRLLVDRD